MKRFLNGQGSAAVFMSEGKQLVAGELILSDARTAVRGQDEAIATLVRQHARLAYRIAYAVLRSPQDAEDAVQETFVRVLRYRERLDAVENPKTWLARIAWRVAVDRSAKRSRKREVALEDSPDSLREAAPDQPADEAMHDARVSAELEKLIAALPRKLREPLILSTIEEMSPREVGATMGINEAAVRSRVFRARQILREKLAGHLGRK